MLIILFFFGPTRGVVASVRRGNYRFWDHSSSCTGVTIHYPTGEVLSDESKCYPSNCGCEGGEQPDNNGCLPLAFGTEPGENQSGEMWLIPPDRMTPMVHYLQNLFSRLRRNLGKFFFPLQIVLFQAQSETIWYMLLFESIWQRAKLLVGRFSFPVFDSPAWNDWPQAAGRHETRISQRRSRGYGYLPALNLNKISRENCFARLQKCTLANAVRS